MAELITVNDLEGLSAQERRQAFEDSIVWDPARLPAEQLAAMRERGAAFAAARDAERRPRASGE